MSRNIIGGFIDDLLTIIFQGLEITELDTENDKDMEQDENDQKWTVMVQAYHLLAEVSALHGEAIFERAIAFATEHLQKSDWLN